MSRFDRFVVSFAVLMLITLYALAYCNDWFVEGGSS